MPPSYGYSDWKDDQILIAKLIKSGNQDKAYDHLQTVNLLCSGMSQESMTCKVIADQSSGMILMWDILDPGAGERYRKAKGAQT